MTPTVADVQALADSVWHVLADMGAEGTSVCPYGKAALRVAYEPFLQAEIAEGIEHDAMDLGFAEAKKLIDDCDAGR